MGLCIRLAVPARELLQCGNSRRRLKRQYPQSQTVGSQPDSILGYAHLIGFAASLREPRKPRSQARTWTPSESPASQALKNQSLCLISLGRTRQDTAGRLKANCQHPTLPIDCTWTRDGQRRHPGCGPASLPWRGRPSSLARDVTKLTCLH